MTHGAPHSDLPFLFQEDTKDLFMEAFLKNYGDYIRAKARTFVPNQTECEDLVADTIAHVYEKISRSVYVDEGKFDHWLYTVIGHFMISWLRKYIKRPIMVEGVLETLSIEYRDEADFVYKDHLYKILQEAIEALDVGQREVLRAYYQEGVQLKQIARQRSVPYSTFYKQFQKILSDLKAACIERGLDSRGFHLLCD